MKKQGHNVVFMMFRPRGIWGSSASGDDDTDFTD